MSTNTTMKWSIAVLVLVVVAAGGAYLLMHRKAPVAPTPTPAVATTAPAPAATVEQHPISQAAVVPAHAATTPLPALGDSDGMVRDDMAELAGNDMRTLLVANALIPRIVATVNALPGEQLPPNVLPVHAPTGSFIVKQDGDALVMSPDNLKRYHRYAAAFEKVDPQLLVTWYVHDYPLFEEAWRQLGMPNTHFNDRLVDVLDLLLKTPVPAQPPKLEGAGGLYHFVDPQLENLAIGQKILLRLGAPQQTAVMAKLRAIRALLVGQHPEKAMAH